MQIRMGVRNFGKIEYAEAGINGFSVFVGNNNSGKTYLMQLIYGLRKNLAKYAKNLQSSHLDRMREASKKGIIRLDADTVKDLEAFLNEILDKKKENIVLETFHEKIDIGELYVRIVIEEEETMEYLLWDNGKEGLLLGEIAENLHMSGISRQLAIGNLEQMVREGSDWLAVLVVNHILGEEKETQSVLSTVSLEEDAAFQMVMREMLKLIAVDEKRILFMPASRTGLLTLYKEFFAQKADEAIQVLRPEEAGGNEAADIGLTQPVYEFLRFMQTFQPDHRAAEKNGDLIQFMENYLMEGKVYTGQGNRIWYQEKNADRGVPLYLSSSMINELTPALYALQSTFRKDCLIWDEIETSLHPQKQTELARLLVRMSNQGFQMIVSTHSDTMATRINNLCLLSYSENLRGRQKELLKRTGLKPADLLRHRIHVYQFTNGDNGKSQVSELHFHESTGYEFTQFMDAVEQLFQETRQIME